MSVEFYQHPLSPFCRPISLIAKLIGVKLDPITVNLLQQEHLKPEYLEKNPFHQVPTVNDNGFYLSESRAIAGYLVDKYAPDHALYPQDVQSRATIDQMLYFDSGTLAPALQGLTRPIFYKSQLPGPEVTDKAKDVLKTLDLILSKRRYVAGDTLSIADIAIRATFTLNEILNGHGILDLSELKHLTEWSQNVIEETSPAYGEINDEAMTTFKDIVTKQLENIKSQSK